MPLGAVCSGHSPRDVKEENFLRPLVEQVVQQVLEAEMDKTLGAQVDTAQAKWQCGSELSFFRNRCLDW